MAPMRSWGRERRWPRRDGPAFQTWVPRWTLRLPFVENAFPQTLHWKGLSPVWVRMWIWRALALEKDFRHSWQTWRGTLFRPGLREFEDLRDNDEEEALSDLEGVEEEDFVCGCWCFELEWAVVESRRSVDAAKGAWEQTVVVVGGRKGHLLP